MKVLRAQSFSLLLKRATVQFSLLFIYPLTERDAQARNGVVTCKTQARTTVIAVQQTKWQILSNGCGATLAVAPNHHFAGGNVTWIIRFVAL